MGAKGAAALAVSVVAMTLMPALSGALPSASAAPAIDEIEALLQAGKIKDCLARADELIARLEPQDRMISWSHAVEGTGRLGGAWLLGSFVIVRVGSEERAFVLDSQTGARLGELPLPPDSFSMLLAPGAQAGEVLLLHAKGLGIVNAGTWKVTTTIAGSFDPGIAPVPYGDGFLVVPGPRAHSIALLMRDGCRGWQCALPGYVLSQPALYGNLLVVQTRQASYGGQATSGIDADRGILLWSEVTDAYGCGADFGDDATFVVEMNIDLRAGNVSGLVICREPRSGRGLWEYRRPGTSRCAPYVEKRRNRVFVVFDEGAVLCLNGKNGHIIWETRLPAGPRHHPTEGFSPQWSTLGYSGGSVTVLDAEGFLNVLEGEDGRRKARFPIAAPYSLEEKRSALWYEVVATPLVGCGNLIVPCTHGIIAYPAARLAGSESLELRARALRAKALLRAGDLEGAQGEFARLCAADPLSRRTLDCGIEIFAARRDREKEVLLRTQLLKVTEAPADPRLREHAGLLCRLSCGYGATPPLLAGTVVLAGGHDGLLRAYDVDRLTPAGTIDAKAAVNGPLALHGGAIVFPCGDRTVCGVSPGLDRILFRWPVSNESAFFADLNGTLVRSWGFVGFARAATVDPETGRVAKDSEIAKAANAPVLHAGVLYYPQRGGGSVGYDGTAARTYPPVVNVEEYRVNSSGARPMAYGDGGVYAVDDHCRPIAQLVPCPGRAYAAAENAGVVAVLHGDRLRSFVDWQLELWRAGGKLSLIHRTPGYGSHLHTSPRLVAFGDGFLLVGRDLVYVDADHEELVWRFWAGEGGFFQGPVLSGGKVFFTHSLGALYVFEESGVRRAR